MNYKKGPAHSENTDVSPLHTHTHTHPFLLHWIGSPLIVFAIQLMENEDLLCRRDEIKKRNGLISLNGLASQAFHLREGLCLQYFFDC